MARLIFAIVRTARSTNQPANVLKYLGQEKRNCKERERLLSDMTGQLWIIWWTNEAVTRAGAGGQVTE